MCAWRGCHAVMNSWALLEKHIPRAHLHHDIPPDKGATLRCGWGECEQLFSGTEELYQHCLIVHMGEFSARCPFGESYRQHSSRVGRPSLVLILGLESVFFENDRTSLMSFILQTVSLKGMLSRTSWRIYLVDIRPPHPKILSPA